MYVCGYTYEYIHMYTHFFIPSYTHIKLPSMHKWKGSINTAVCTSCI